GDPRPSRRRPQRHPDQRGGLRPAPHLRGQPRPLHPGPRPPSPPGPPGHPPSSAGTPRRPLSPPPLLVAQGTVRGPHLREHPPPANAVPRVVCHRWLGHGGSPLRATAIAILTGGGMSTAVCHVGRRPSN